MVIKIVCQHLSNHKVKFLTPFKHFVNHLMLESESRSVLSDSLSPHGHTVHGILGHNTEVGSLFPSPGDLPNPGIESSSHTLQADSLPAEPQR